MRCRAFELQRYMTRPSKTSKRVVAASSEKTAHQLLLCRRLCRKGIKQHEAMHGFRHRRSIAGSAGSRKFSRQLRSFMACFTNLRRLLRQALQENQLRTMILKIAEKS